jgi:Flp pilus assembly pilin Flp
MKLLARDIDIFCGREDGQTLSEHAIIILFLVIVVIAGVALLGPRILAMLTQAAAAFGGR